MVADSFLEPLRHRRFREGDLGIDCGRETVFPAVRDVPVTVPAGFSLTVLCHLEIHLAQLDHFRGEFRVAADAVVHNDLGAGILGGWHLRFAEGEEGGCVLHAVEPLEGILARYVLVGDVAVVAGGDGPFTPAVPYNLILSDLQSTIVSAQEAEFVKTVAEQSRSFEYFVIDYNVYPDDLTVAYAEEHEGLFDKMDLSIISASTIEKLTEALDALNAGTDWADVVSAYSEDGYASNGGSAGTVMVYSLLSNLADEADLEKVTSLEQGTYSEPIASPYGYTIYKADKALEKADYSDEDNRAVCFVRWKETQRQARR